MDTNGFFQNGRLYLWLRSPGRERQSHEHPYGLREEEEEAYRKTIGIEKFPKLKNEEEVDKYLAKSNITKFIEQLGLTKTQFRKLALRGIQARTAVEQKNESTYGSIGKLFNMTTYLEVRHLNETQLRLPLDYQ